MSGMDWLKHIGITVLVSFMVVILVLPLFRPKAAPPALPSVCPVTPELRTAAKEYREKMEKIDREVQGMYKAGTMPLTEVYQADLERDLAYLEELALDAPSGRAGMVSCAVVSAFYNGRIVLLQREAFSIGGKPENAQLVKVYYRARVELARLMPEVKDNTAFSAARVAWEKQPTLENLKKMFEAEVRQ